MPNVNANQGRVVVRDIGESQAHVALSSAAPASSAAGPKAAKTLLESALKDKCSPALLQAARAMVSGPAATIIDLAIRHAEDAANHYAKGDASDDHYIAQMDRLDTFYMGQRRQLQELATAKYEKHNLHVGAGNRAMEECRKLIQAALEVL